jgi:hypothetical protein
MNVRSAIAIGVLSLIGSSVYAVTGDAADYYINREIRNPSTVARSEVQADVREARAAGELRPAGEAESYTTARVSRGYERSRAEVKAEVLAARASGELIPAGEGVDVVAHATTHGDPAAWRYAHLSSKVRSGQ